MPHDEALREHLVQLLEGGHAHATFDHATSTGSDGTVTGYPPLTRIAGQVMGRYFF